MKKISLIIAIVALSLSTVSCEDYLNKVPLDENSDATNWTSEDALETYAWSLYDNFIGYGSTRGQYMNSSLSDNICMSDYSQPTQTIPSTSSAWEDPYEEIRRANILLARVDVVPDLDEDAANHWRGVARFFRAMKHAELVLTYGDVVWVDSEIDIDDAEALSQARDDRYDVMMNVCEDLEFAGNNCEYTTDNTVNNMVAWALLSRLALYEAAWQKYHKSNTTNALAFYQKAKDAASKVISSGYYSIHSNYVQNYISKDLNGNSEMILFKIYQHTAEGASVTLSHGTQGWSASSSTSASLTKSAMESFTFADGLPIHMGTYSDATMSDIFSNRDGRLSQIVDTEVLALKGYAYIEGINSTTGYYADKFVDWTDYGSSTWLSPSNTTDAPLYSYSEVLVNYAEACAEIEDLGGGSMSQNDLDISVNQTRINHGGLPGLTYAGNGGVSVNGTAITADPKNDTGINVLLWEIRRERRNELMCDGFRYQDLLRWQLGRNLDFASNPECYMGISKAAIDDFYAITRDPDFYTYTSYQDVTATFYESKLYDDIATSNFWTTDGEYLAAYNITTNIRVFNETSNYLEPIPSTEIVLNPNLTQNPGW